MTRAVHVKGRLPIGVNYISKLYRRILYIRYSPDSIVFEFHDSLLFSRISVVGTIVFEFLIFSIKLKCT